MSDVEKILKKPCAHETGAVPTSQVVPDFHPLSYNEMRDLILYAFNNRGRAASAVQVRLGQAIEGHVCPHEIEGPVARKSTELDVAFVESLRSGDASGAISKVGKILGLKP